MTILFASSDSLRSTGEKSQERERQRRQSERGRERVKRETETVKQREIEIGEDHGLLDGA
jgi:hypothetical protein